jgi:hypothetical protein
MPVHIDCELLCRIVKSDLIYIPEVALELQHESLGSITVIRQSEI